jgi:hypothetical protein
MLSIRSLLSVRLVDLGFRGSGRRCIEAEVGMRTEQYFSINEDDSLIKFMVMRHIFSI